MKDATYERLIELLDDSSLSPAAVDCVLAAAEGEPELAAHLAGRAAPARRSPAAQPTVTPARVYLEEIAVEGFRGVGRRARLQLEPGPGLTLVVGRNGSGKSSFAEGLEVLLTGTTLRWEERTKVWQEGWRNLHHEGVVSLDARFRIDGEAKALEVGRTWPTDATLGSPHALRVSGPRDSWDALGWQRPLEQFRPILSYNELGTMFTSPTRAAVLYDALSAVLGLEDFDAVQSALRQQRLASDKAIKGEREARKALRRKLEAAADPRAATAATQLRPRTPDLEAVMRSTVLADAGAEHDARLLVALELPPPDSIAARFGEMKSARERIEELEISDASRLDALAGLLETGLAFHNQHSGPSRDCPLCGTEDALDEGWLLRTHAEAQELRQQSRDLRQARNVFPAARAGAADIFARGTWAALAQGAGAGIEVGDAEGIWEAWSALLAGADDEFMAQGPAVATQLLNAVREAQRKAVAEQATRDLEWRPLRDAIADWVSTARAAARPRDLVGSLKDAETWMKWCTARLRDERLAPVVEAALANWTELRHESNVMLGGVALRERGNQRSVTFDVVVDGTDASAFGVMSQGELSALAISIFLPRAMLPGSPFAFILIDDPVQSMDPAKVDGLARVLARAAGERQVIVFTHDERLPEAVRRLDIDARIMQVQRRAGSKLEIIAARPPSDRHIGEAFAFAKADDVPDEVRARVIPGLCRCAIEAACAARLRRTLLEEGTAHAQVEERLASITSLTGWLAAALNLTVAQGREIREAIRRLGGDDAVEVVDLARRGTHERLNVDGLQLVQGARRLVRALEERPRP
jgi:ABC-type lipoprotein export system ATPase subunit